MAEQAEAGNIRHRGHPGEFAEAATGFVQGAHPVACQTDVFGAQLGLFLRGSEDADPQRLAQEQLVARLRGIVAFHVAFLHQASDGQAEDRLRGIDGVPAGQRDARFVTHGTAATNHFTGYFRG